MFNSAVSLQSGRSAAAPDLNELHRLLSQALARREQHIVTKWRSQDRVSEFTLDVISTHDGGDPKWKLTREDPTGRQLLFDYASCDVLLVHNSVASASGQAAKLSFSGKVVPDTPPPLQSEAPEDLVIVDEAPAFNSPHIRGDLAATPLESLLENLRTSKLTGRLELRKDDVTALLFVTDGQPVDATTSDAEGDDALVELLTWNKGNYHFEPRVLRNSHTVHQPIESLIAQSKQLAERNDYLAKSGMQPGSVLIPRENNLSDAEFAQKAYRGSPLPMVELTRIYRGFDGKATIDDLLYSMQLPRVQLTNVIYHLVINGLAKFSRPIVLQQSSTMTPRNIETGAIQSVMMSLRRLETGMFLYPAFLYFLEQEYFRCYRSKTPLSVIVFEMCCKIGDAEKQPLPSAAVLDAVLRISQLKRHVDLLAHYDSHDYAMLLPNTKTSGAQIFAKRIVKSLTESALAGEVEPANLSLAVGCASMPEDFSDLSELLGAADMAMAQSRDSKKPVIMYRDIKPIKL